MYTFRNSTRDEIYEQDETGCKMYGIDCTDEKFPVFYGKMRTVFGKPYYISDDYKDIQYWITADDGQNKIYLTICRDTAVYLRNKVCFVIYNASGDTSVLDELIEFIESAEPSD